MPNVMGRSSGKGNTQNAESEAEDHQLSTLKEGFDVDDDDKHLIVRYV